MVTDRSAPDDDVLRHPPPLLVVEIASPSTRDVDFGRKRLAYGTGGAGWYWIVDLLRPEAVVFENVDGTLVEVQRITTPAAPAGPFTVVLDLSSSTDHR